jgi:predicted DNA-binding protein (UPF0251 family)/phage FluMu protein Com
MARPKCCRRVGALPACPIYKPTGVPRSSLQEVSLAVDEFEALRLADYEGLYQEQAAGRMRVSRQTFGRIIEAARKKVATVLVEGLALRIEGGEIEMAAMRTFQCADCGHVWEVPFGTGRPAECPACKSKNFQRVQEAEAAQAGAGTCGRRGRQGGAGRRGAGRGRGAGQGQGMGRASRRVASAKSGASTEKKEQTP